MPAEMPKMSQELQEEQNEIEIANIMQIMQGGITEIDAADTIRLLRRVHAQNPTNEWESEIIKGVEDWTKLEDADPKKEETRLKIRETILKMLKGRQHRG